MASGYARSLGETWGSTFQIIHASIIVILRIMVLVNYDQACNATLSSFGFVTATLLDRARRRPPSKLFAELRASLHRVKILNL